MEGAPQPTPEVTPVWHTANTPRRHPEQLRRLSRVTWAAAQAFPEALELGCPGTSGSHPCGSCPARHHEAPGQHWVPVGPVAAQLQGSCQGAPCTQCPGTPWAVATLCPCSSRAPSARSTQGPAYTPTAALAVPAGGPRHGLHGDHSPHPPRSQPASQPRLQTHAVHTGCS